MTATTETTPSSEPPTDAEPAAGSGHKARRRAAVILIVIASILTPIAVDALWLKRTVLDTDRFVEQLAPLAEDPAIQALVADRVADALIAQADLETRLGDLLPENLQFLDGTLSSAAENLIRQGSVKVVESDQFANVWEEALRLSHSKVVAVLTGDTDVVQVENGIVSIDLSSLRDSVRERVSETGLARFLPEASEEPLEITLYESDALASAQSFVQLLKVLGFVLPFVVIVLFAAAIALAVDRRKAVFRVGLGITIAMVVQLVGILLGRSIYLDAVAEFLARPPAEAIYDILLDFPRTGTRAVLMLGLVLMIGAAVYGSSSLAVRTRAVVARGVGRAGDKVGGDDAPGPFTSFVARYRKPLDIAVLVLAALVLISFDRVTPRNMLLLILLTLLVLAVVHILAVAGAGGGGEVESGPETATAGWTDAPGDRPPPPGSAPTAETPAAAQTIEQPATATAVEDAPPPGEGPASATTVEQEPASDDSSGS